MNRETEIKDCSAALMIHAVLFSYQKAHGRIAGNAGKAVLRFAIPYLAEMLKIAGLPEICKDRNLDENISIFNSMVKKSGYIQDAVLRRNGDNSYIFETKNCRFASDGHKIFNGHHICPFALLAAAVILINRDGRVSIDESDFLESGSRTSITLNPK